MWKLWQLLLHIFIIKYKIVHNFKKQFLKAITFLKMQQAVPIQQCYIILSFFWVSVAVFFNQGECELKFHSAEVVVA